MKKYVSPMLLIGAFCLGTYVGSQSVRPRTYTKKVYVCKSEHECQSDIALPDTMNYKIPRGDEK